METARCKAFVAAGEMGSFSKAAEILSYTPSGVSQLVTAFEKELGIVLLRRNKKGVELTENGKLLIPIVREFLLQENRIYEKTAEMNGLLIGNVTIAAYSSIATHWLPAIIRDFEQDYPQIKIRLMEGIRQEVTGWLEERVADIGLLSYQEAMPYDWMPLREDEMLAILPKSHPLANASGYPLINCMYDRVIMPALGRDDDVAALFDENQIKPNIQFTTLENFAAMAMVEQGLGISIMNDLITQKRICDVVKMPLEPKAFITLGIAAHSFDSLAPAVKVFVKYAVERLTKQKET